MIQQFLKHSLTLNTCSPLPLSMSLTRVVQLLQLLNLHWHSVINQNLQFIFGFLLGSTFYGCGQTYSYKNPSLQSHTEYFHCLNNLLGPTYSFFNLHQPLATTAQFIFSIDLPFPECHMVEVKQCVTFSDWLI